MEHILTFRKLRFYHPPAPSANEITKTYQVTFQNLPWRPPTTFFSNKKYPFTFQNLLKTPPPGSSINHIYAPSTNSIMICTVCHQQQWKYNMAVYYSLNHVGHDLPEDCQIECTEEDRVKKLKF